MERLKFYQHRASMRDNYYTIWKQFNTFYLKLDGKTEWEDRVTLFVTYLINNNKQSATVKSYISALKAILRLDGIELKQNTRACKLCNDHVHIKMSIRSGLLNMLVMSLQTVFKRQSATIPYQTLHSFILHSILWTL